MIDFDAALPSVTIIAILLITLIMSLVWRSRRLPANRQSVRSALLALLLFIALFALRRSLALPSVEDVNWQKAVAAAAIILTLNAVIQFLRFVVIEYVLERRRIHIPLFVLDLLTWLTLLVLAIVVVGRIFGVALTGVLVTSTVVSAVIGLALQDTLGNLISGIALQIEYPYRTNDWVQLDGHEGQIVRQNWRSLILLTRDNHHVLLTNANVARGTIINFSQPAVLQAVNAYVGLPYDQPPDDVKRVLREAVRDTPGVMAEPKPRVELLAFGDSSINYRVRYWITDFAQKPQIHDRVMTRIWYGLRRADMSIPFPIRDVNMRVISAETPSPRAERAREECRQTLADVTFLRGLDDEQLRALAQDATQARYTDGEQIIAQGAALDGLVIMQQGSADMQVSDNGGEPIVIGTLGQTDAAGLMGVLTNEPSSYALIARGQTTVVRLPKAAFATALAIDPDITAGMIATIRQRRQALEARVAEARAQKDEALVGRQTTILNRLSRFLGMYD